MDHHTTWSSFSTGTVDVDTTHHFILGAPCPVFRIAFGTKRLDGRRPAALADDRLPGVRGCFCNGCHCVFRTGVPNVYRVTQGLTEENFYLVDKYGGQGQNRTADTGIFSTKCQILTLIFQALTGTPVATFAPQCTTVHN